MNQRFLMVKWKSTLPKVYDRQHHLVKIQYNTYQRVHSMWQNRFVFIKIAFCPSVFDLKAKMNNEKKPNKSYLISI
jgi:hypothetical protein